MTPAALMLAGLVLYATLAPRTGQAASPGACRNSPCSERLIVDANTVRFRSEQLFDRRREKIALRLVTPEGALRIESGRGRRGCLQRGRVGGTRIGVDLCAAKGPVRVAARRIWGGTVELTIHYRAHRLASIPQGVAGTHAHSDGSGGVAPPGSGGVGSGG